MRWRQCPAIQAENQPLQQRWLVAAILHRARPRAGLQQGMHLVPQRMRHDRLMLAGIDAPLVLDLAHIGAQVQYFVDIALVEQAPGFAGNALRLQALHGLSAGGCLGEEFKHLPHAFRLGVIHDQLAIGHVVAERHLAPHRDHMLHAFIFADELRARQGPIIGADAPQHGIAAIEPFAKGFQALACFWPQPAIGGFLDAI